MFIFKYYLSIMKRILILAPHTDDGEFGCGGTIFKLIEQGNDVYYAAFSACQLSVAPEFPADILIREVKEATIVLGIKPQNLILFDYDVRTFNYKRQEILDDIIRIRNDIRPDIVYMPSVNDIHQDHYTISFEGIRAFKFSTILCYEMPWNNFSFHTTAFQILEERHLEVKLEALAKYKSQAKKPYANAEFIKSLAHTRGIQVGAKYAEVFEVVRLIL
jgi:N-acetylglucosamine malate deacetylase 1